MMLVVDTNVFISALIKDSATRKIITNSSFEFLTPAFIVSNFKKGYFSAKNIRLLISLTIS